MDAPTSPTLADVIAMLNRKGGVGKTSLCFHLSAALAARGQSVLLIDFDPQANLTEGFLGTDKTHSITAANTTAAIFDTKLDPEPEQLICQTIVEGVSLVPGSTDLENFDYPNPQNTDEYQFMLRHFVQEVRRQFDIVLIDCNPSLKLLSWNALVAAEFVMVPFQPEDFGAHGMTHMQQIIDSAVEQHNRRLRLLGYVLNKVGRKKLHELFEKLLRTNYPGDVLETIIPDTITYPEAITHQVPVGIYKKRSKAAQVMNSLADEIACRMLTVREQTPRYLYPGNINNTDRTVSTPEPELRKAV